MVNKGCIGLLCALFGLAAAFDQQILSSDSAEAAAGVLWRFNVTQDQRSTVLEITQSHDLDVWHAGRSYIDIYSPSGGSGLPKDLQELPHTTSFVSQPQRFEEEEDFKSKVWNLTTLNNSTFHERYHTGKEIKHFLQQLVELNPNTTSLSRIGLSYQERNILALHISTPDGLAEIEKKKKKKKRKGPKHTGKLDFVIVGAQHAREWVATATSLYLAHALTFNTTHAEPHGMSSLLDVFNFHIIPLPNPDGYSYAWKKDRYWYKNRQVVDFHSKCVGVDMNRNWGYKWKNTAVGGQPAVPADPCSHWYPGSRPFESPEVNSIANFVNALPNPVAFIDLRSYGQTISAPFSYSCKRLPKDAEDQAEAAFGAARAIQDIHDVHFQEGTLCENLYAAPGNLIDWMYKRVGIKYTYSVHLRDTGTYGFSLPEKLIRPVGEETASMVRYFARFIAKKLS
ncbi:preprocarboxypeptidase A2 [Coprinopsis sp. MPI-PUGE-AT-0042]|nr:preprocarboxypeptidase A2 [Coprinopsis sp. MPI-PUGE-AT-0042]